jgi:hypothetical protein
MGILPTPEASSHMPETFKMEALSRAYVSAIAAQAGVNVYMPQRDFGTDMIFSKVIERKEGSRHTDTWGLTIPCQIKASTIWGLREDTISYDLEVKNYNDLVNSNNLVLILMCLPPSPDEWLYQDEACLRLHRCCYYWRTLDKVETTNTSTKRIFIPRSQIFTVESLIRLVEETDS